MIPFRRNVMLVAVGQALAALGALSAALVPGLASSQDASPDVQKGERIEVTGSSIKRIDAESALPVQVITRQDIQRSGVQSTEELVKTISAFASSGSVVASMSAGANTASVSTVSLRGLGGARTLVLINGRRSSTFGGAPGGGGDVAVDVSSIPLAAIERVEVLKDGASAIYGSDAIAGVINFILRSDYAGGEVSAQYGYATQGGASTKKVTATIGFGDIGTDRFNVMLNAAFEKDNPLYGHDRKFADTSIHNGEDTSSGNTFPANIFVPYLEGTRNPAALAGNCYPSVIDYQNSPPFSTKGCRYDPAALVGLLPDVKRENLYLNGRFALTPDIQLYSDASYSRNVTKASLQAAPVSDQFSITPGNPYNAQQPAILAQYPQLSTIYPGEVNAQQNTLLGNAFILLPPTSQYYPTAFLAANYPTALGNPLLLRYRTVELGARKFTDVSLANRVVFGSKGTLAGWDFDTSALYSESKVKEFDTSGISRYTSLLAALNAGIINPFGPSDAVGEAALVNSQFIGQAYATKTSIAQIDAKASRELVDLPAGPLAIAVGGNLRHEKYGLEVSPTLQQGDTDQYGGNVAPLNSGRNVSSVFSEIDIPIVKGLELDGAVRFDKYQGIGTTINPKASLRYQPTPEILLRASWGKGFRAPSLTDLYAPVVTGVSAAGSTDPLRCPYTNSPNDCSSQFQVKTGGNAQLTPERSESWTAGMVFEPTRELHVGVDFFKINLSNTIAVGGIGTNTILSSPAFAQQFANLVTRAPNDPTVPGGYGAITSIDITNANLYDVRLRGFDVDAKYRFMENSTGRYTFGVSGTYFTSYNVQLPDGTYTSQVANNTLASINGVIPRWKSVTTLAWERGPINASATYNFQAGYQDVANNLTGDPHTVGTYETWDAQIGYSGIKSWNLQLGLRNILNRDPPFSNSDSLGQFQSGYDAAYGDPRGRFIYAGATYRFM